MTATSTPSDQQILSFIGKKGKIWIGLKNYVESNYPHVPLVKIEGKNNNVVIRYRRGGKSLITIYPRKDAFTALVVLGKDETRKLKDEMARLSKNVLEEFNTSKQYHDGKWLWIRPARKADIESIKIILGVKRRPRCDHFVTTV